jgi:negative regulator of sigma E activity
MVLKRAAAAAVCVVVVVYVQRRNARKDVASAPASLNYHARLPDHSA